MADWRILRPEQHDQWMEVLGRSFQHDFYHLPQYHALAERRGEGQACLFVYTEEPYVLAVPLLLRSIGMVPGLAAVGQHYWDATSVYGYAGPLASHPELPAAVLQAFQASLQQALREQNIVALFSRLHPLLPQRRTLAGIGECKAIGSTVSMDLSLPLEMQRAQYRRNHKHGINKLKRLGAACLCNTAYLDEFIDIYYETMRRVGAAQAYFFERAYFENLIAALDPQMHLFVCAFEQRVMCGGLFSLCGDIVQYHLGGTRDEYLELAPMKLLFDSVRVWANQNRASVFHLGGGTDAHEDSLFHFKAGFSNRVHEFAIWRWVLSPDVYGELCAERERWNMAKGAQPVSSSYFPAYRCPTASST